MSEPVRVRSVDAVVQLSRLLDRFVEDVEPLLLSCERNANRSQETLADKIAHWRRLIESCEAEVEEARRDLRHCEEDEDADCSEYEADVTSARRRLRGAEAELATTERWQPTLSEAVTEFRSHSRRLRQLLATQGAQAQAFLKERLTYLDKYSSSPVVAVTADHAHLEVALSGAAVAGQPSTASPSGFDPQHIRAVAAVLSSIPGLRSGTWVDLENQNARLEVLQQAENGIASVVGRPALPVLPAQLGPGEFGLCDGSAIWVNQDYLEPEFVQQMILTLVHEGRHAYQYFACRNPEIHADARQLADWQWNVQPGNYVRYDDNPFLYRNQPVEADAFAYEDAVMESYLNQGGD